MAKRAPILRKLYASHPLVRKVNVATSRKALALSLYGSSKTCSRSSTHCLRAPFAAGAGGGDKRAKRRVIAALKSEPMIEMRPTFCGRLLKMASLRRTDCRRGNRSEHQLSHVTDHAEGRSVPAIHRPCYGRIRPSGAYLPSDLDTLAKL